MELPPSRMMTATEIEEVKRRCLTLQEPPNPTPQLLACLAHWRQQSEQRKATMTTEEGT